MVPPPPLHPPSIGRLQLAAILVYFAKQAKITFVIHGDIGSETTKLYVIRYNVYIKQAKYRKSKVNCLAGTDIINQDWRLIASSDVMCKQPIKYHIRVLHFNKLHFNPCLTLILA